MSLINQMLRDLEQRRTAGGESSPLGGLSASGSVTPSVDVSINDVTLISVVAVILVSGVVVAYLLGGQQQTPATENLLTTISKKEIPVFVESSVPENTKVLPTRVLPVEKPVTKAMVKPDDVVVFEKKMNKTAVKDSAAEKMTPMPIKPGVDNAMKKTPVGAGENINKIIRPLTDEQQSQLVFQRAIHMLSRNNQQGAQLALEEALSFSPDHLRARETLAALLLNAGRMSEAANHLHEGLQLMPHAAPLAKLYARILVDQGDVVAAVTVLEQARPAVAVDPEYHALLAALYRQEGKHAQAAQSYQQVLSQRPGVASWWMGLALAQDAMGETAFALDAFQRAQHVGGLDDEVLKYVRARIVALTSLASVSVDVSDGLDEFGE